MTLVVLRPGLLSSIQDAGRIGWVSQGVGRSGALDLPALKVANRAVGNTPTAAGIEILVGGAEFSAGEDLEIAVAGAIGDVKVDGSVIPAGMAVAVPRGEVISFGNAQAGARYYLAVAGGVSVPRVLGSASWDGLAGVGGPPLAAGQVLQTGTAAVGQQNYRIPNPLAAASVGQRFCAVMPGPRLDWFGDDAWHTLVTATWEVGTASNRTGLRLQGPRLRPSLDRELPSEALIPGAIQVPPDGAPIVFLSDHPATGGYPVIGVVRSESLAMLGQLLPGHSLRFNG